MKKVMTLLIAMVLLLTAISAGAQTIVLPQTMYNYTADCSFSISFNSGKDVVSLLKELDMLKEVEYYVDVEKLLESILSDETKVHIQADISQDMQKAQIAITADDNKIVAVNKNLNVDLKYKCGLWIAYDFTIADDPGFEIVMSAPDYNKYVHMDIFEVMNEEDRKIFDENIKNIFSKEYVDKVNSFIMESIEKYAEIQSSKTKVTVRIDNTGFIGIMKDIISFMKDNLYGLGDIEEIEELCSSDALDGIHFLGEDGIVIEYTLSNGKISSQSVQADFSLSVANLYTAITGEVWDYISEGNIDFSFNSKTTYYKVDNTKAELPIITEENSFSYKELIPDYYYDEYHEPQYPKWWVYGDTEKLPVVNGKIYFPFREVMEEGYEDSIQISYDNGAITVSGENLPDCKTITLTVGSDKAYFDNVEKVIGTVINDGGTVFVSEDFFTQAMGWSLDSATRNIVTNDCYYSFDPYITPEETAETETVREYPTYYVWAFPEKVPVIDGVIYVPLRAVLEDGYEESVEITYNNGTITATSEFFTGFRTMTMTVGSDKILFDGEEKVVASVINENGTVYVSSKLFTDIFGWEISYVEYNMLNGVYTCEFITYGRYE